MHAVKIFSHPSFLAASATVYLWTALVTPAQAATQYRDRYIPGAVCMVDFNGATINAGLIQEIGVLEPFEAAEPGPSFRTLRVTMVNQFRYDQNLPKEEAGPAKAAFLKMLRKTCK